MKKNILIIGRHSFISVNLFHYFKSRTNVKKINEDLLNIFVGANILKKTSLII